MHSQPLLWDAPGWETGHPAVRALQCAGNPKELDMGMGGGRERTRPMQEDGARHPPDVHRLGKQHSRAL